MSFKDTKVTKVDVSFCKFVLFVTLKLNTSITNLSQTRVLLAIRKEHQQNNQLTVFRKLSFRNFKTANSHFVALQRRH